MTFAEYVENLSNLAAPTRLPEHLPIMYAISQSRPIAHASVDSETETLSIKFEGCSGKLLIWDNGQSCCETRYMSTDDLLPTFTGAKLVGFEVVDGPDIEDEYGDAHEQMFVKLETTMGTITLVTHNEHNGYYGGFDIESRWED
jgi:hypothetical protein